MRKVRLSFLLIVFNLGVAALAILVVGIGGVAPLRKLAAADAIQQVRFASTGAAQALERSGARLQTSARLLGERPTLNRLLAAGDRAEIVPFLETFRRTSDLAACAALEGDSVYAASGENLPWGEMLGDGRPEGGWLFHAQRDPSRLVLASWAPVVQARGAEVVVASLVDEAYVRGLEDRVGLTIEIVPREWIESEARGLRGSLHLRALSGDGPAAARVGEAGLFVSAAPLRDPMGHVVGVVEAHLPTRDIDSSVGRLLRRLFALAVVIGSLAVLFGVVLARLVARPVRELTESSARIGRGDLGSPVPRAGGVELGNLSAAMEEMREQLLRLTTDLRRRRAEAEAVLTGIVEGVYAVDRERRVRYMNPQAAAMIGVRTEETFGRFCGDVLRPRLKDGVRPCEEQCPILHARFRGKAHATEFLEAPGDGGKSVVITSAPSGAELDETAADALQYQVIRDETEVEATRRLRDSILSNISHEFRTPLSAQLASLELLRDRLPDEGADEVRELVLSIERGTLRLTRLIDNLLESTRIEAGRDDIRRKACALDEIVEEAVELMVPLIEQRKQTVDVHLPYPLPQVEGDAQRLVQVIVNLLANANKFSPTGGSIRIGGDVGADEIRLWIEDEGPGLPAGTVDALFQRFIRSPDEEPEPRGMGLGLYIVKSIVERHGGRVEAESSAGGTRMIVVLPRGGAREDPGGR